MRWCTTIVWLLACLVAVLSASPAAAESQQAPCVQRLGVLLLHEDATPDRGSCDPSDGEDQSGSVAAPIHDGVRATHQAALPTWLFVKHYLMYPQTAASLLTIEHVEFGTMMVQVKDMGNGRYAAHSVAPASFDGRSGAPLLAAEPDGHASGLSPLPRATPAAVLAAPSATAGPHNVLQAGALLAVPVLLLVAWALFTRFSGGEALQHPKRQEMQEQVAAAPGITLSALAQRLELSLSATVHHLRILEQTGHLETRRLGRQRHVFLTHCGRSERQKRMVLHHDKARCILDHIRANPGCNQKQLAQAIGIAPSLAYWHLTRLAEAELVSVRREGRARAYRLRSGA